jgi:cytochrome c biogenesis protein CcmG/thiol:disulfide interchange protein DsbE
VTRPAPRPLAPRPLAPRPLAPRPLAPRPRPLAARRLAPPLAALLLAATATASCSSDDETPSPFADCATTTQALAAAPPAAAGSWRAVAYAGRESASTPAPGAAASASAPDGEAASAGPGSAVAAMPDLRLPCFTGGEQVALRDVRGPAVINLWASWCGPCRTELPVMQQLADRAAGRLTVLGVDTGDDRAAGASFADGKGVRMPTLFDADRKLLTAVGRISLPVTIFVDAAGKTYVHPLPLDAKTLADQVRTRTGVTVTP